jgi:hypothetical protein
VGTLVYVSCCKPLRSEADEQIVHVDGKSQQ